MELVQLYSSRVLSSVSSAVVSAARVIKVANALTHTMAG